MIGNSFIVEAIVRSLHLKSSHQNFSLTLKIGENESGHSIIRTLNDNIMVFNEILRVNCGGSDVCSNNRLMKKEMPECVIIIYGHDEDKVVKIGYVCLNIDKVKLNRLINYSIQGCENPDGKLQLSLNILEQEIKKIQIICSPKSATSLAELKQFHNFLNNKHSHQSKQNTINYHYNKSHFYKLSQGQQKKSQISKDYIFCEQQSSMNIGDQTAKYFDMDQSILRQVITENKRLKETIQLTKQQKQQQNIQYSQQIETLKKQLHLVQSNNSTLKELLFKKDLKVPQKEQKPLQLPVQLRRVDRKHEKIQRKPSNERQRRHSFKNYNKSCTETQIATPHRNTIQILNNVESLSSLTQQNEIFYRQIKEYQILCENLKQQLKNKEINEAILQQQNEQIKQENRILNKKINKFEESVEYLDHARLVSERQILLIKNKQLQRKLSESIKAIDEFRIQAMNVRNQLILKESIIDKQNMGKVLDLTTSFKNESSEDKKIVKQLHEDRFIQIKEILNSSIQQRQSMIHQLTKIKKQKDSQIQLQTIKKQINGSYLQLLKGNTTKQEIMKEKIKLTTFINENFKNVAKQQ